MLHIKIFVSFFQPYCTLIFHCHKFFRFDKFYKPPACKRSNEQKVITMTPSKLHKIMSLSTIQRDREKNKMHFLLFNHNFTNDENSTLIIIWQKLRRLSFSFIYCFQSFFPFFFHSINVFLCVNSAIAFH